MERFPKNQEQETAKILLAGQETTAINFQSKQAVIAIKTNQPLFSYLLVGINRLHFRHISV